MNPKTYIKLREELLNNPSFDSDEMEEILNDLSKVEE